MFRVVFRLQELPPFSEPSKNNVKPPFQAQMKPLKTGFGKIINNFYHFKVIFYAEDSTCFTEMCIYMFRDPFN